MKDLGCLNLKEPLTVGVPDVARYTFYQYRNNAVSTLPSIGIVLPVNK